MRLPVDSYEAYRSLIAGKRLNNNSYFDFEIKRYIAQGRLSFIDAEDVLFLFFSEAVYEQVVIYAETHFPADCSKHCEILCAQSELPWVCNVVFRSDEDSRAHLLSAYLEKLGFCAEYINYEYALSEEKQWAGLPDSPPDDLHIGHATTAYTNEICRLWRASLPAFVLSSLDHAEIEALIADGKILIATNSEGKLCGALYYDSVLGKTTIHHLAVASEFRRRGLGGRLIDTWLSKTQGSKLALTWIEKNNFASANLFHKFGFCKTSKRSYQYVRRNHHGTTAENYE